MHKYNSKLNITQCVLSITMYLTSHLQGLYFFTSFSAIPSSLEGRIKIGLWEGTRENNYLLSGKSKQRSEYCHFLLTHSLIAHIDLLFTHTLTGPKSLTKITHSPIKSSFYIVHRDPRFNRLLLIQHLGVRCGVH